METIDRFLKIPKGSFFLFGPRGTGKSTLITTSNLPNTLYFDLLDPETFRALSSRPELLGQRIDAAPGIRTVILDEVQKIPQILDVVHRLIERKSGIQFVLTGSSSRKLKRGGADLLAGRALLRTLHAFMASELKKRWNFERSLRLGMLPVVLDSPDPEDTLRTYAALYLREEVQMEGLVRNIGNFSRFMEAMSFSHAAQLNISNVARDCQIERKVVEGYVSILEDLLLGFRLNVFQKRAKRELSGHPKFYYFDAGVFRSLRPKGPLDHPEEIERAALEGLVGQHLSAWIAYTGAEHSLSFWKTRSGVEVDFIIYGPSSIYAVEVKNTNRVRPEDLRALKSFREDYPSAKLYLLYRGEHRIVTDGILCVPCMEFLARLIPDSWPYR
jgi:predicted AAA+ superfamily ATPase